MTPNDDPLFAPCPPDAHHPDLDPRTMTWSCTRCGMLLRATGLFAAWGEAVKGGKATKKEEEETP